MSDLDLVRKVCAEINKAEAERELNSLAALLRAILKDDQEEIRIRARFFARRYGLGDKDYERAA